jgi:hypothetical protein
MTGHEDLQLGHFPAQEGFHEDFNREQQAWSARDNWAIRPALHRHAESTEPAHDRHRLSFDAHLHDEATLLPLRSGNKAPPFSCG